MPRTSYLLNFCAGFTILASLQVWTSWLWIKSIDSSSTVTSWSIAWCDSSSSFVRWASLYLWALSGALVIFYILNRIFISAYSWTIFSFVSFWCLAFTYAPEFDKEESPEVLALLVFTGLMIWSRKRYKKRLHSLKQEGESGRRRVLTSEKKGAGISI